MAAGVPAVTPTGSAAGVAGGRPAVKPSPESLQEALRGGFVTAHFQPIVSLPDREVIGFEALARLRDPHSGMLPPSSFIPLAEEHGVIGELGERMLRLAVGAAARWRRSAALSTATVSTNVSPAQLVDPRFPELVGQVVRAEGLVPSALLLEITENAAVADGVRPTLLRLARMGVRLALDDFGMGFANLDHLRRLPVHVLKLDRSFVVGATAHGPDRSIVRAAVDLAGSLGMTIIAEGVEQDDQADALHALGCRHAQGLLFADAGPHPLERARSVRRVRRLDVPASPVVPWEPDVEARVLAFAQLVSDPTDLARGATHGVAARLAAVGGEDPEVCFLAPRMALVHDEVHRLDDSSLAADLAGVPGIRALRGDPGATTTEHRAAAVVRLAARVVAAASEDAAPDGDATADEGAAAGWAAALGAACARLARARGPWAAALAGVAGEPLQVVPVREILLDLSARHVRRRGDADRLRSLVGLSQALVRSEEGRELLRVALEESRRIMGAASASLDRWDLDAGVIRTLINVGDLGPGDLTFPKDETYEAADFTKASYTAHSGVPGLTTRQMSGLDPGGVRLLGRLGRGSSANVPLVVDNEIWGQLYFTTGPNEPDFSPGDFELLVSVATVMSAVVAQAKIIDRVNRLAFEDPLTGLGTRRVVDDALAEIARAGRAVTVALLDVDELKRLNDRSGHARGDEVLRGVASAVAEAVPSDGRWTLGRVGGDEFAVVLDGRNPDEMRRRLERARRRCLREQGTAFSFGVSAAEADWEPRDLLSAADDALYRAKRRRRG
ncbi:MAG: EAL domain-containing protein [Kineosporiaceae bacterium]